MKKESLDALGAVPVVVPVDGPVIVHQGVYRLYQKPNGDMRVQYKRDDMDGEDYFEIPAAMQRLAKLGAEGKLSPGDVLREVMSLMRSMQ